MFTAILLSPTPESGSLVVWFFGALVVWFGGSIGYHGFVSRSRIKCGTTEIVLVDGARLRIEIPNRAERVRDDGVFSHYAMGHSQPSLLHDMAPRTRILIPSHSQPRQAKASRPSRHRSAHSVREDARLSRNAVLAWLAKAWD